MEFPKDISKRNFLNSDSTSFISEYITNNDALSKNENYQFKITNCSQIYPGIENYSRYIFSEVFWSKKHPYIYKPYQFMHFNYHERSILHENPPKICYGY